MLYIIICIKLFSMEKDIETTRSINDMIFTIRGQKVMLDWDLAKLYEVPTFRLNEAVKRNKNRFPDDFMFQITREELLEVIANCDILSNLRFSHTTPYAFTEQGVAMLASILNSDKAININIEIIRAFVRLRQYYNSNQFQNVEELKKMLLLHIDKCDNKFEEHENTINDIIRVLNNLIDSPNPKRTIGFINEMD